MVKGNLDRIAVIFIILVTFLIGIFLAMKNITGYVIYDQGYKAADFISILFMLLGVFGIFYLINIRK